MQSDTFCSGPTVWTSDYVVYGDSSPFADAVEEAQRLRGTRQVKSDRSCMRLVAIDEADCTAVPQDLVCLEDTSSN